MEANDEEGLPLPLHDVATRAAVEGIPVAAIARVIGHSTERTYRTLKYHLQLGTICEMPRADWPPTARLADRTPSTRRTVSDGDIRFAAQKLFRLTNLEAAFLTTLLKAEHADKTTLHHVVEAMRFTRASQPSSMEVTDPKMVDVMICKLRRKLREVDNRFADAIKTIWGLGYHIEPPMKALLMAALVPQGEPDGKEITPRPGTSTDAAFPV
jgi:hypothetical protein